MKISNNQTDKVLQSYTRIENKKDGKTKSSGKNAIGLGNALQKNDSVIISSRTEEVRKAKELYNELPDVRQELVDELKERISSGDYKVASKEVADKIMHRAIVDKTV